MTYPKFHFSRWLLVLYFILNIGGVVFGQTSSPPSPSLCRQWDDAYLAQFYIALGCTFIFSLGAGVLIFIAGRWWWWATSPGRRIITSTILIWSAFVIWVILLPRLLGFFGGIDNRYLECTDTKFGASGIFNGFFGEIPAIAQWPAMIGSLSVAALLGGLGAWIVILIFNRLVGIQAKVTGTE